MRRYLNWFVSALLLTSCSKPADTASPTAAQAFPTPNAPIDTIHVVYDSNSPQSVALNGTTLPLTELPAAMKVAWKHLSATAASGKPDPWSILKIELDKKARTEALHQIHDAAYEAGARHAELIVPGSQDPDLEEVTLRIDVSRSVDAQGKHVPINGREPIVVRIKSRQDGEIAAAGFPPQYMWSNWAFALADIQRQVRDTIAKSARDEVPCYILAADDGLSVRRLADTILWCEYIWLTPGGPGQQLLESVRLEFPVASPPETPPKKIEPLTNLAPANPPSAGTSDAAGPGQAIRNADMAPTTASPTPTARSPSLKAQEVVPAPGSRPIRELAPAADPRKPAVVVRFDSRKPDEIVLNNRSLPWADFATEFAAEWRRVPPGADGRPVSSWDALAIQVDAATKFAAIRKIHDVLRDTGIRAATFELSGDGAALLPARKPFYSLHIQMHPSATEVWNKAVSNLDHFVLNLHAGDDGRLRSVQVDGMVPPTTTELFKTIGETARERIIPGRSAGNDDALAILIPDDELRAGDLALAMFACQYAEDPHDSSDGVRFGRWAKSVYLETIPEHLTVRPTAPPQPQRRSAPFGRPPGSSGIPGPLGTPPM